MVFDLTKRAFAPMPYSDSIEVPAIAKKRNRGELHLSSAAEHDGHTVGHIAFSDVWIGEATCKYLALGPISVTADQQLQGIGSAMTAEGLSRAKALGYQGAVLNVSPKVYRSMGFVTAAGVSYKNLPAEIIQQHIFSGPAPTGALRFAGPLEGNV